MIIQNFSYLSLLLICCHLGQEQEENGNFQRPKTIYLLQEKLSFIGFRTYKLYGMGFGLCPVVSGYWTHQDTDTCPVASGHWTCQDTDTCPRLDMCPHHNVSNGTSHWTQAPPIWHGCKTNSMQLSLVNNCLQYFLCRYIVSYILQFVCYICFWHLQLRI